MLCFVALKGCVCLGEGVEGRGGRIRDSVLLCEKSISHKKVSIVSFKFYIGII